MEKGAGLGGTERGGMGRGRARQGGAEQGKTGLDGLARKRKTGLAWVGLDGALVRVLAKSWEGLVKVWKQLEKIKE